MGERKFDIYDRTFEFAVRTAKIVGRLPKSQALFVYGQQLLASSSSIGANLEEADGALTKKDFINKLGISRREARESRYWCKLLVRSCECLSDDHRKELHYLIKESHELMLILSSIINKVQNG